MRFPGHPTGRPPANPVRALALVALLALGAASCTDSGEPPLAAGEGEVAVGLRTGLSCDELVDSARTDMEALVDRTLAFSLEDDAIGIRRSLPEAADEQVVAAQEGVDTSSGEAAPVAPASGGDGGEVVAGTNLQEDGVDEADILKTDGERIVALTGTTLRVVRLDGSPALDGSLVLPGQLDGGGGEMFLRGDEVVLLVPSRGDRVLPEPVPELPASGTDSDGSAGSEVTAATSVVPFEQGLRIIRVDISEASEPRVVEEKVVEGSLVSSRMVDGTVRVVVRSPMGFVQDMWSLGDPADLDELLDDVSARDILPAVSTDGEVSYLGACEDLDVLPAVSEPPGGATSGSSAALDVDPAAEPNTVTVLTIGDELGDMAPVSVAGLADIVYASTESLYVTNTGWGEQGASTYVHRFDTSTDGPAEYTGSGIVPGFPLDKYSLSESGEMLRIVTTTDDPTPVEEPAVVEEPDGVAIPVEELAELGEEEGDDPVAPDEELRDEGRSIAPEWVPATEGRLTVLSPAEDGTLVEVGSIEDLGVGETVRSVRFLGDMAYVVTFRQTDPLYAIDLSDPTDPTALGELKITGFSEYLHPVGDGLLLGLGREATEDGFDTGFKASLFDVTDPTDPREVDKWVVPGGWSEVGNDPHSFTWDPVAGHAVFPLQESLPVEECPPGADCGGIAVQPSTGAVVLAVGPDGLSEVARIRHDSGAADPWLDQIRRSVVVDRDLWTMGYSGLGLTDADLPGEPSFVAF